MELLLRLVSGDDLAVGKTQSALRRSAARGIVRDHHDGLAFLIELLEIANHLSTGVGIEVSGGFIGEDDRWIIGQHPRQRHALLLSHAQFTRFMMDSVPESDPLQEVGRPFLLLHLVQIPPGTWESGHSPGLSGN